MGQIYLFCERGHERLGFIEFVETLESLKNYYLLKKNYSIESVVTTTDFYKYVVHILSKMLRNKLF